MAGDGPVLVDARVLDEGASDTDVVAGQIEQQLGELKGYLAPLVASWAGQASSDYQALQQRWNQSADDLTAVLREVANALRAAAQGYVSGEDANASMWEDRDRAMSGQFQVDPGLLESVAQEVLRCEHDFAAAVATLKAKVQGAGSPWGSDLAGSMFGEIYTECTSVGLQLLDHTAALLGSIAIGLDQMAKNVQVADQGTAATFGKIS